LLLATSTTARGALDLYNDSRGDDDIPISSQVRTEQQRIDTRSLAAKESDRFFALAPRETRETLPPGR
jgi:hypothetical protein